MQDKHEEADALYLRAFEIREKALGPDDPSLAESLNNRVFALLAQVTTRSVISLSFVGFAGQVHATRTRGFGADSMKARPARQTANSPC